MKRSSIRKHGAGTYWKDKRTGRWCWQIQATGRDGISHRKKITAKSLEILTQKVESYRQKRAQGIPTDDLTVEQWARIFLNSGLQSVYVSGLKYVLGMTQFTADFFLQSVYVRELKYVMFYT